MSASNRAKERVGEITARIKEEVKRGRQILDDQGIQNEISRTYARLEIYTRHIIPDDRDFQNTINGLIEELVKHISNIRKRKNFMDPDSLERISDICGGIAAMLKEIQRVYEQAKNPQSTMEWQDEMLMNYPADVGGYAPGGVGGSGTQGLQPVDPHFQSLVTRYESGDSEEQQILVLSLFMDYLETQGAKYEHTATIRGLIGKTAANLNARQREWEATGARNTELLEANRRLEGELEEIKTRLAETETKLAETETKIEETETTLGARNTELLEANGRLEANGEQLREMETRLAETEATLQKKTEELAAQSQLAMQPLVLPECHVCKINQKSHFFNVCGHAFCDTCATRLLTGPRMSWDLPNDPIEIDGVMVENQDVISIDIRRRCPDCRADLSMARKIPILL